MNSYLYKFYCINIFIDRLMICYHFGFYDLSLSYFCILRCSEGRPGGSSRSGGVLWCSGGVPGESVPGC